MGVEIIILFSEKKIMLLQPSTSCKRKPGTHIEQLRSLKGHAQSLLCDKLITRYNRIISLLKS